MVVQGYQPHQQYQTTTASNQQYPMMAQGYQPNQQYQTTPAVAQAARSTPYLALMERGQAVLLEVLLEKLKALIAALNMQFIN